MKKNKRSWISSALVLGCIISITAAQASTTQFEAERTVLLQRIKTIQEILRKTETQKKESTSQLNALNTQIETNTLLIQSVNQELKAINQEIQQKQRESAILTKDLTQLQKEYAAMVCVGAKALHDIHELMFIFSAPSFHHLVQRLRYVKQYTRIRNRHYREIKKTRASLQVQQATAHQRLQDRKKLLHNRQTERNKLTHLKAQQAQIMEKLTQQHTQLTKELQHRNKAVKRLDKLIKDIIQQALQTQTPSTQPTTNETPTANPKAANTENLTTLFRKSRGKLPWPVKSGFISRKFGIGLHPVLRNVRVENLGIDIRTPKGAQVYTIFEGVVKAIAFVPGMNRIVIIQHGAYHSVYAKLRQTNVKVGQYVQAQTPIGTVATDSLGVTELQLQLWHDTQKLNPAGWLSKK